MWTEQFEYMMMLVVMATLLRTSYELSGPKQSNPNPSENLSTYGLQPWQKAAAEKAVRKYAEAQPKKWRNWNEAMFERSA
jgi:hypothetical protein